ncbi:MAG: SLC13 family permease [Pseudomonadota bacterium]
MENLPELTTEIGIVNLIVVVTVILFVAEMRVDLVALLVLTLLGLLVFVPGLETLLDANLLFSGLSSNAVVSIIAVMILGAGLEKTGVMERVAWAILRYGAKTEKPIISVTSSVVALISSFMQNVGAVALFLPVMSRISSRTGIAMSRIIMPAGFCAILGGTITMVASSPLIMLNDLLDNANRSLPADLQMSHFDLFDVAPIGLALVVAGIGYFLFFGDRLLPSKISEARARRPRGTVGYMRHVHGIDAAVREVVVPIGSPFVGRDIKSVQREYEVRIVASRYANKVLVAPPVEAPIAAPATLAVIAEPAALRQFLSEGKLQLRPKLKEFRHLLARSIAGVADLVIPPESELIGKSVRDIRLRTKYGLSLLSIYRNNEAITTKLQDIPLRSGDTLICHIRWDHLAPLERDRDFIVVTADYPREERSPYKVMLALAFFATSIGMVIFTDILLPLALLAGAIGMVVSGVLTMDEAYDAVSWKTVFLLAGLLPLGHAVQGSGAAQYVAAHLLYLVGDASELVIQAVLALTATAFSLFMSNVGATVLLVPIAISVAVEIGASPALFALIVAISTSNSFILPTHQVNALIQGPGGYRVGDFVRVGSMMTAIFLVVSLLMLNLVF